MEIKIGKDNEGYKKNLWSGFIDSLEMFTDDFMTERNQPAYMDDMKKEIK